MENVKRRAMMIFEGGIKKHREEIDMDVDECDHDWEFIENENPKYMRAVFFGSTVKYGQILKYNKDIYCESRFNINYKIPVKKVCLKCGKCYDEEKEWEEEEKRFELKHKKKRKERRRRKAWAKQLWDDGCKK
jgi:hypothetical protein